MVEPIRWAPKRDRDGRELWRCWITDGGYTVAENRTPDVVFTVSRPLEAGAFAYCADRDAVTKAIVADMASSAAPSTFFDGEE